MATVNGFTLGDLPLRSATAGGGGHHSARRRLSFSTVALKAALVEGQKVALRVEVVCISTVVVGGAHH